MKNNSRQADLLDILDGFLQAFGQPMHYKDITKTLIDGQMWEPYGEKPDQIVYSAMHQDMRKRGAASAFRLMAGGVFCTSETAGIDKVAKPVPPVKQPKEREVIVAKKGDTMAHVNKRTELKEADAKCGNCVHIRFSGIEEYRMNIGECNNHNESGRCCARFKDKPCGFHQKITLEGMEALYKRREQLRHLLIENRLLAMTGDIIELAKGVRKNVR